MTHAWAEWLGECASLSTHFIFKIERNMFMDNEKCLSRGFGTIL